MLPIASPSRVLFFFALLVANVAAWEPARAYPQAEHSANSNSSELKIVLVAVLKQESRYVGDWLRYHELLGIRDFVLIPNECDKDSYEAFLDALPTKSVSAPQTKIMLLPEYRCEASHFMGSAFKAAALLCASARPDLNPQRTRLAFWDIDEFPVFRGRFAQSGSSLADVLEKIAPQSAPAWTLITASFGTSDRQVRPSRGSVVGNFVLRVPLCNISVPDATHIDPFMSEFGGMSSFHGCRQPEINVRDAKGHKKIAKPYLPKNICRLDELLMGLEKGIIRSNPSHDCFIDAPVEKRHWYLPRDVVGLQHYTSKSQEEFEEKAERGYADGFQGPKRHGLVPDMFSKEADLSALATLVLASGCANFVPPSCHHRLGWAFGHEPFPPRAHALVRAHCSYHEKTVSRTSQAERSTRIYEHAYAFACSLFHQGEGGGAMPDKEHGNVVEYYFGRDLPPRHLSKRRSRLRQRTGAYGQ